MLYPGHLLLESYPSAEKLSVYSAAPADWLKNNHWRVLLLCSDAVSVFYIPNWLDHRTLIGRVLPLYRDTVCVFYIPSRLGHRTLIGRVLSLSCSWYILQPQLTGPTHLSYEQVNSWLTLGIKWELKHSVWLDYNLYRFTFHKNSSFMPMQWFCKCFFKIENIFDWLLNAYFSEN